MLKSGERAGGLWSGVLAHYSLTRITSTVPRLIKSVDNGYQPLHIDVAGGALYPREGLIQYIMRTATKSALTLALSICLTAWVASSQTPAPAGAGKAGDAKAKAKATWPPEGVTPRTADGKPDLSGNWQPNAIRENVDLVSVVEVPMLPAAAAIHKNHKDNISKDDPEARCLPPGVPRMSTTCLYLRGWRSRMAQGLHGPSFARSRRG